MAPLLCVASALALALLVPTVEGMRMAAPMASANGLRPSPRAALEALKEDTAGGPAGAVGVGMDAEAICAEVSSVRLASSTLKQLDPEADPGQLQVSAAQISDYFVASQGSVRVFLEALSIDVPSDSAVEILDVSSLCSRSMRHVAEVLKWPLPEWRGHLCTAWSPELRCLNWVSVSGEAVEQKARQLDLASELAHLGDHEAHSPVDLVRDGVAEKERTNASSVPAAAFDYSEGELAVQIANLFNVFPSDPGLPSTSSFLEASAGAPPRFGPRVRRERRPIWGATMARSEAWVDNAFRKMAAHPKLLQAWFGSSSTGTRNEVRRVMSGMRRTLGRAKIKVGKPYTDRGQALCHKESATMAYVLVTTHWDGSFSHGEMACEDAGHCMKPDWYVINICERYWNAEFWNQDASRYGTMVHESSHHHGPDDVSYKGAGAYGRSQCLRMAAESPKSALNNADNFKWFVYYVNRCAGTRGKPLKGSPCSFNGLTSRRDTRISLVFDGRPVSGLTVKVLSPSGEYARPATHFSDFPQQQRWTSEEISMKPPLLRGQTLVLLYESECAFWEARASAENLGSRWTTHSSRPVVDMVERDGSRRPGIGGALSGILLLAASRLLPI